MNAAAARVALLVDDSRFDYLETRNLLLGSEAGIDRLDWCQEWTGADAVLASGPYDLFLVDMHLGSVDGLDVIRQLRAAGVRVPVIALTGQATHAIDRACSEAGASDFLVKGQFDRAMLERAIRYAEQHAATHRELDRLNAALERRAVAENEQARLMRLAIDQSTDAMLITQPDSSSDEQAIVYVNASLCRLLGRRAGELLGLDLRAIVAHALMHETLVDLMRKGAHAVAPIKGGFTFVGATGSVAVTARIAPLRASMTGPADHWVWNCVPVDGTTATNDPRVARSAAIGSLTVGLAHDIGDRLTTVAGQLERIAPRLADDEPRRWLATAQRAAGGLVDHARLLLALAIEPTERMERLIALPTHLPAIAPLLHDAAGPLVSIEFAVPPDLWPIRIDEYGLNWALVDLVIGAEREQPRANRLHVAALNLARDDPRAGPSGFAVLDTTVDHVVVWITASRGASAAHDPATPVATDRPIAKLCLPRAAAS